MTVRQVSKVCLWFFPVLLINSVSAVSLHCPCKVVKVPEGDTVHVLDQQAVEHKIRLRGIDAPEKKQVYGAKSTNNLAQHVAGKYILVEYQTRGRYDGIIGKLLKNGQDINLLQIREGFAWYYAGHLKEQSDLDRILYNSAENEARKKTIGLWSVPTIPPWEFRKK